MHVSVIGGGLAGCEAAWQMSKRGIKVSLYEMRGVRGTPAHKTDSLAELVCSNSFRSDDKNTAIGLLHDEMRAIGSVVMQTADEYRVPAGSALAVDREMFSSSIQNKIIENPNITLVREEIKELPKGKVIIATGPLTSDSLCQHLTKVLDLSDYLYFFDAISPIIYRDSIDFDVAWMQSRYDKGDGRDYINCPLNEEQYYNFVNQLILAEKTEFKDWEKNTPYFNGCLPIEVMAERGKDTLRYGPMKPVGLTNPNAQDKAFAVVQLRQDNIDGTSYNMVGFQTKMKYHDQKKVLSSIPGLKNLEFARFGGVHRNTFINSPSLLNRDLSLRKNKNIKFAGQITGVEGYVESAALGLISGIYMANEINDVDAIEIPRDSAIGSLIYHITNPENTKYFQPMNINFGLFRELDIKVKKDAKKSHVINRAVECLDQWKKEMETK